MLPENAKGWSYRLLFASYLKDARAVVIRDPFVRAFYQVKNVMEFLQMAYELVPEGDEMTVHLVTQSDTESCIKQAELLDKLVETFTGTRIAFTWELDVSAGFHARSIVTDTGWKISVDRGLDIFLRYEAGAFSLEQALQETRLTRGFEVTYLKG